MDGARPLRIALVAPNLDILGGQGVQAQTLRELLEGEGYAVDFIPTNPRFGSGLGWLRRVPGLRTVANEALYAFSLRRLRDCDVVHVFTASYWSFLLTVGPAMAAARLCGKRLVLNYHSGEASDHLARWGALVHPLLRAASDLVVPSEYLRRVFAHHGYRARVVPNALSFAGFTYRERKPLRPRILSTRNLERHYGVGDVIEAFALLRRRRPDATLAIAGTGSEEARLRALARERCPEGVTFLGRVDPRQIPALCDRCDVYVNASLVDNQPLSILEAFAAGLPVVSTPTGDIASMIETGQTGLLVPRNDPGALADAIESLLDDPEGAAQMARRAHERVQAHAWPRVKQGWVQVYAGAGA